MPKLLVSCGTLASGGAERVLSILSKSFADTFDDVIYLTWIDMPDFYPLDDRVKRVCVERECGSKNIINKSLWFRKFICSENVSLILSFLEPFNVLICGCLMGTKVPIVVADRNDPRLVWNDTFHGTLRKLFYKRAQGIVCQTEHNRSYYKGKLLERTYVIFNPIFLPEEYLGKALNQEKQNKIVSVVRLEPQKNIPMLLRAFYLFQRSHQDFKLVIYGEGKLRQELEMLIEKMGMTENVEMPGAMQNVWDLIINAKCFALSSWYEGLSNALMEALCLGLPCVATKVSGAVDFINDGENGLLVDLDDEKAMSDCFGKMAEDTEFAQMLGMNAVNMYSLLQKEVICKQWVDYLKSFVSENN